MPRVDYKIDAKADTVVILKNPNASFAPWSLAEAGEHTTAFAHESTVNESTVNESTVNESTVNESTVNESTVNESTVNESTVNESASGDTDQEASIQVAIIANDASESNPTDTEGDEIWYYVSRRHLVSAAPTFERMLSETNWTEGIRNENDGLYHVPAEDWDSEALLYVLQVLHLRNGQVPRTVSLEMLAKIAVLIDFYQCAEALESFTERWVEHLQVTTPVPSYFCRNLMLWMCIAWVLRLPQEFVQTTTVSIRRDDQELPTLGLPITICVGK
jgi:hypothetical protein